MTAHSFARLAGVRRLDNFRCDTSNGGSYKLATPAAELNKLITVNAASVGNIVALIRMAKMWKSYCYVPIKSFYLEQLALEFIEQWLYVGNGAFWYDWMMRDFFRFMLSR